MCLWKCNVPLGMSHASTKGHIYHLIWNIFRYQIAAFKFSCIVIKSRLWELRRVFVWPLVMYFLWRGWTSTGTMEGCCEWLLNLCLFCDTRALFITIVFIWLLSLLFFNVCFCVSWKMLAEANHLSSRVSSHNKCSLS